MSRNAPIRILRLVILGWSGSLAVAGWVLGAATGAALASAEQETEIARVVIVHDRQATQAFRADHARVRTMVDRGMLALTGKSNVVEAWRQFVSTQDVVGLKVFSAPGPDTGTRREVVAAVVEGLLQAQVPATHIVVWDKSLQDLRAAGFEELVARYGIRLRGSSAAGYDEKAFYESQLLGQLIYGEAEFGLDNQEVGRKSFVSKLITKELTKIVNLPPMRNHNRAGVSGNLYSLTTGSVDNTFRFETSQERLTTAVPEIYALPELFDRVVLNIVDALICQYEGEQRSLLHYSSCLNELRFSTDPVALDVLSLQELERLRQTAGVSVRNNFAELYQNASMMQLGVSNPRNIQVERLELPNAPPSGG